MAPSRSLDPLYQEAVDLLASYAVREFVAAHPPVWNPATKDFRIQTSARYADQGLLSGAKTPLRERAMAVGASAIVGGSVWYATDNALASVGSGGVTGFLVGMGLHASHLGRIRREIIGASKALMRSMAPDGPIFPDQQATDAFHADIEWEYAYNGDQFRESFERHPQHDRLALQPNDQLGDSDELVRQAFAVVDNGPRLLKGLDQPGLG